MRLCLGADCIDDEDVESAYVFKVPLASHWNSIKDHEDAIEDSRDSQENCYGTVPIRGYQGGTRMHGDSRVD